MIYKAYIAKIESDLDDRIFAGRVAKARDIIGLKKRMRSHA